MRSATTYQDVCERVIQDMKGKVPDDIHSDIEDVLCSENKDFARVMNTITEKLNLSEIADVVSVVCDFQYFIQTFKSTVNWYFHQALLLKQESFD